MRRCLFTFLSFLSLLLFVATCVLWVRSYVVGEQWIWGRTSITGDLYSEENFRVMQRKSQVNSEWYRLSALAADIGLSPDGRTRFLHDTLAYQGSTATPHEARSMWNSLGFYCDVDLLIERLHPRYPVKDGLGWIAVPHWFLAVLTAFLPAMWLVRLRRRRRLASVGCCISCGYDLRASPDRCPECGVVPAIAAASDHR